MRNIKLELTQYKEGFTVWAIDKGKNGYPIHHWVLDASTVLTDNSFQVAANRGYETKVRQLKTPKGENPKFEIYIKERKIK